MAIAESERSGLPVDVAGVEAVRKRVTLHLARLHPQADLAAAGRAPWVAESPVPQALEARHLMSVPQLEQAIDRPTKIDIREILSAWRAADRALGVLHEDSPDWARVNARLVSLRTRYHQLFAERSDRPLMPEGSVARHGSSGVGARLALIGMKDAGVDP